MLSPILVFTDFIPIAGGIARSIATVVSGVISFVIVLTTVLLLNYWWICFLGISAIVIGSGLLLLVMKQSSSAIVDNPEA